MIRAAKQSKFESWKMDKFGMQLGALEAETIVAAITYVGSFCPIIVAHLECMVETRKMAKLAAGKPLGSARVAGSATPASTRFPASPPAVGRCARPEPPCTAAAVGRARLAPGPAARTFFRLPILP
jgi:hypothetical protein